MTENTAEQLIRDAVRDALTRTPANGRWASPAYQEAVKEAIIAAMSADIDADAEFR